MTSEKIDVVLGGCSIEPMSNYLKALGVFRLVAEQADPEARGYWKNGVFFLQSKLNKEELAAFFLTKYAPTPIISPWNKDGGFLGEKKCTKSLRKIANSTNPRLKAFSDTIKMAEKVIDDAKEDGLLLNKIGKKEGEIAKSSLIVRLRNNLPDKTVRWIDAVLVITSAEAEWKGFPLLGSGGNDGRAEFSGAFIERITDLLVENPNMKPTASETNKHNLLNALFGQQTNGLQKGLLFGQLNPSAVGNFNASTSFVSESHSNPWDYVLALEGTFVFAGAAVRKYEKKLTNSSMAFPFSIRSSTIGYGTAAKDEETRSEVWLPTWEKPARITEIETMFSEGRTEFSDRSAKNVMEFAQSIAALGTDRGLNAFHRYAFIKRNGEAFFAVKLDTLDVRGDKNADLLREPIEWIERSRKRKDSGAKADALREIEENLLRLCHLGFEKPELAQETIIAFGRLIRESVKRKDSWNLKPRQVLDSGWLDKADDGSAEFRLAASIASLLSSEFNVFFKTGQTNDEKNIAKDVDNWLRFSGKPFGILNIIMADRVMRMNQKGDINHSKAKNIYTCLEDVNAFIEDILDDKKIIDLMIGFMFLKWWDIKDFKFKAKPENERITKKELFPGAGYALAKLCYTYDSPADRAQPGVPPAGNEIRPVPAIHKRMASGDGRTALELAMRRLRASGCRIPKYGGLTILKGQCERIAAALLFPLDPEGIRIIRDRILE